MKAQLARFVISLIAMLIGLIAFWEFDAGWMPARRSFAAWPTRRQFGAILKSGSAISISRAGIPAVSSVAKR